MGQIVTVNFRGDQLYGFESDDGTFVALKPMVESMGLNWEDQCQRLVRDPILSEGTCSMQVPFGRDGAQQATCLKLELVNGWLFTIDTAHIKDRAVHEKVILYQRECYQVLQRHFYGWSADKRRKAPAGEPDMKEPMQARRQLVTEARQTFGIQSARELWFKLGLETVPSMYADAKQGSLFTYTAIRREPDSGNDRAA